MIGVYKGEILLYKTEDGQTKLDVRLEDETVWLTQAQLAVLFTKTKQSVSLHINNVYKEGELPRKGTVKEYLTVQKEGNREVKRKIEFYNLDVIISVGYRVKSVHGTQFRIWATQVLKDHILKGYSINEKRLKEQNERLLELQQTVGLLGRIIEERQLAGLEAEGLLKVIADYSMALKLLDDYDYNRIAISDTTEPAKFVINYEAARRAINKLAKESDIAQSGLFGREKDDSFKSSLGTIYQTFGGKELYPSIEEKAAHLLYFVVKNHSFIDGNKRIAASLFLWFLDANSILYGPEGNKRIGDNALVALTLMIAESRSEEKDVMTKVIVNLINRKN
jgi:prophage maintenance system killer protein